jgi:hypothetical protein
MIVPSLLRLKRLPIVFMSCNFAFGEMVNTSLLRLKLIVDNIAPPVFCSLLKLKLTHGEQQNLSAEIDMGESAQWGWKLGRACALAIIDDDGTTNVKLVVQCAIIAAVVL